MTTLDALDNPVWHALTGPQAGFALGRGRARHYPRDMAPFSGIAEATLAAYDDLGADLPPQTEARLFRPAKEPAPTGWEEVSARPILQMIYDRKDLPPPNQGDTRIVPLGLADVGDMLALSEATKPGPFAARSGELGVYVGVRHEVSGVLIAMGGERLRLREHVELSAIAVHPMARGVGLGAAITAHLASAAISRGQIPFLHVFPDNPALGLYRRLGFRDRASLWVLWHRPVERRR
jgi:ribosomal protein S18 acetylase RimI-like enzyme